MKLKGAIFDMDGTLLDSMSAWEEYKRYIVNEVLGYYEKSINITTQTTREVVDELKSRFNADITENDVEIFANNFLKPYYENEAKLKEGAFDFLNTLSQNGVKMAVATATKREVFGDVLKNLGIDKFFDTVLTCSDVGKGKSDPLVYFTAIDKIGCDPRDIWVFEDSVVAIRTCKKAGLKVCAVEDRFNSASGEEIMEISDCYIKTFDDLKNTSIIF